jgi:hypothetical protein
MVMLKVLPEGAQGVFEVMCDGSDKRRRAARKDEPTEVQRVADQNTRRSCASIDKTWLEEVVMMGLTLMLMHKVFRLEETREQCSTNILLNLRSTDGKRRRSSQ